MKKLKAIKRLYCGGVSYEKGKTFEASDSDARLLVAYKHAEYVSAEDKKAAAGKKGLSTEDLKQK